MSLASCPCAAERGDSSCWWRVPLGCFWAADGRIQGILGRFPNSQEVSMCIDVPHRFLNYALAERM